MGLVSEKKIGDQGLIGLWKLEEDWHFLQQEGSDFAHHLDFKHLNNKQKKLEFFATRLLIKQILEKDDLPFDSIEKNEHGKPLLKPLGWNVSITHAKNLIGCIIHPFREVGIDIEEPREKMLKVAHKYLNTTELYWANGDIEKHCLLWAIKEACYKFNGKKGLSLCSGISIDIDNLTLDSDCAYAFLNGVKTKKLEVGIERYEANFLVYVI